jgi:serralysin
VFELARTSGGLTDPYLYLYSPSLAELSYDDDSGGSGDARISFTATASGTYYLGAMDFSTGTGAYTLSARRHAPPPRWVPAVRTAGGYQCRHHDRLATIF